MVRPADSCVDTHAPLRGPVVSPALLARLRVSRTVTVTRYFPSRALMTVVSFLHVGATQDCEFCDRFVGAFRGSLSAAQLLLNAVYSTVFLSAAVCAAFDLALCFVVREHPSTQKCAH